MHAKPLTMGGSFRPDAGELLRALAVALLAPPVQAERRPVPSRVLGDVHKPASKKVPAGHSVARRRSRVKAARHATLP